MIAFSVAQLRNAGVSATFAARDATNDVQFVKLAVAQSAQSRIVRSASTFPRMAPAALSVADSTSRQYGCAVYHGAGVD